nr:ankyrin repeat domain-containing protein 27-like [Onthophagus taurus]
MGTEYDENLNENEFFKQLKKNFHDVLRTASDNNWIICIPRKGSFSDLKLTKIDVLEHILIRGLEYRNLTGKVVKKEGNNLIYENRTVSILFYEDFVIKNSKFSIWCIDQFLFGNIENLELKSIQINNFTDCINLLWNDNCLVLDEINSLVEIFLSKDHFNGDDFDIKRLQNDIKDLFDNCFEVALTFGYEQDDNLMKNLKLSVESFMQVCLKEHLFNYICDYTAASDANINKIIRNSQQISLKNFELEKYFEIIPLARLELNKINNGNVVLNKIICLKRVFNILKGVDAEILLKIFIFLIIKSNVFNWIANLVFITNFHFSKANFCDENDFIITTLNAALKFITENDLKINEQLEKNSFNSIIKLIKDGNLTMLIKKSFLKVENNFINQLCHPLCSCDSCEILLKANQNCEIDEKGASFLHHASKYNHPDIIHFLIIEGFNINSPDFRGYTPLHYAVSYGNQHGTFLLLHSGCNANLKDFEEGNTPLHVAVKNGHENCVEALLFFTNNNGENIDVNCLNNSNDTPLHFAAKFGYLNLVKLLVDFGAINKVNKKGLTPLSLAHNSFIKDILINNMIINDYVIIQIQKEETNNSTTKNFNQIKKMDLLLKAIENNDMPLTCFYIGISLPNLQQFSVNNCHPLCNCEKCFEKNYSHNSQSISLENKKNNLNINSCNPEGYTPLHIAAKFGRLDILRLLLDSGALINSKTCKDLYSALHLACKYKRKRIVKELLKCGNCLIDSRDHFGNTPLHYAVYNNDLEIFEMLLSEGCDFNIKNNQGETVWKIAEKMNHLSILRILKERDKKERCSAEFLL